MPKHVFSREERARGGKKTCQDKEHQSNAFRALEEKNPHVARAILKRYYGHVGWPDRSKEDV